MVGVNKCDKKIITWKECIDAYFITLDCVSKYELSCMYFTEFTEQYLLFNALSEKNVQLPLSLSSSNASDIGGPSGEFLATTAA